MRRVEKSEAGTEVRGEITRVFYTSSEFSAGVVRSSEDGRERKFRGALSVKAGDRVVLRGVMVNDPKWGAQLRVDAFEFDLELDANGLVLWLEKSDAARGIGKARARAIVAAAGARFDEMLTDTPEELARVANVPDEVIRNLRVEWIARREQNKAMVELAKWGISPGRAMRLIDAHGPGVVTIIREDPYWLIGRVRGFAFKSVDKIALASGVATTHPSRLRHAILSAMDEQSDDGHTWTGFDALVELAGKLLRLETENAEELVASTVRSLVSDGELRDNSSSIENGRPQLAVFRPGDYEAEMLIHERMRRGGAESSGRTTTIEEVRTVDPQLNDDQAAAVVAAVTRRMAVITGGAGVGKTYTVGAILRAFDALGLVTELCAPTGKAAQRLTEVVGKPAYTIHSMLEPERVSGDGGDLSFAFSRNEENPIDADLVVVDEFSMVDVSLFAKLLRAIDATRTTLLLVGDHNQLPSVGAGACLRDAIALGFCPVAMLSKVVRQAGELKVNVSAVLDGNVMGTSPTAEVATADKPKPIAPWYVLGALDDPAAKLRPFIEELYTSKLRNYTIPDRTTGEPRPIDPWRDVQLLTPMHATVVGTRELNIALQRIRQAEFGVEVSAPKEGHEGRPMPGDKVIFTKNDYELGVMNGTMGFVLARDPKGGALTVEFEGLAGDGVVEIDSERVGLVKLAYAMTVHKSQGSEFPVVVFVCSRPHTVMHHRGLLYTAVSRSRTTAMVIGDRSAVRNCAWTVKADNRRTLASLSNSK